jgi:hypothetical protein
MTEHYSEALNKMEAVLHHFESLVPKPKRISYLDHFVFRYTEKTIQQAIIQKLARTITGLKSAQLLLEHGFFQEQAAIQRMLDEFEQDVNFLSLGLLDNDITELHEKYLDTFYEEEFDTPEDPVASKQKRAMVPRKKIIAYIARANPNDNNPSRGIEVTKTLHKAYSGFIHGASFHIMSMYGGDPPRFHVSGLLGTPHEKHHRADLWNYFYRGLMSFELAAHAFGELKIANELRIFSDSMALYISKIKG